MDVKTNRNKYSYSSDWNLMTYLNYELNTLTFHCKDSNIREVVEKYLQSRVKELKENLK